MSRRANDEGGGVMSEDSMVSLVISVMIYMKVT